jgi:diaminopimelate epimerase
MKFVKMHGTGNSFILIDHEKINDPSALAKTMCHFRHGIGSDGLLILSNSDRADVRMDMYDPDGTKEPLCGNGLRCVARYLHNRGLTKPLLIETDSGLHSAEFMGDQIKVDLGKPTLPEHIIETPIEVYSYHFYSVTWVRLGGPHAIIFGRPYSEEPAKTIEKSREFSEPVNVHFATIVEDSMWVQSWERGVGKTLSCGTGIGACCVAAHLLEIGGVKYHVHTDGGRLVVEWDWQNSRVFLTGPAVEIFEGDWI